MRKERAKKSTIKKNSDKASKVIDVLNGKRIYTVPEIHKAKKDAVRLLKWHQDELGILEQIIKKQDDKIRGILEKYKG